MRRFIPVFIFLIAIGFTGCGNWLRGDYHSVEPHKESDYAGVSDNIVAKDYSQLREAMVDLVESGAESGMIFIPGFSADQIEEYTKNAVEYVTKNHSVGAYAVNNISFDQGTYLGQKALSVSISYNHNRAEILRIKYAADPDQAVQRVIDALVDCESSVVFRIGAMDRIDFSQRVRDYMDTHPQDCMELPQVTVNYYPEKGNDRVVEVIFTYQTSTETLRTMQKTVQTIFSSSTLYVSTDAAPMEKYAQLYAFLMERFQYTVETSITPSYSLLRHGVGDSKAFATVFAAMCQEAGLDCNVVTGTKDGIAHYWNVIFYDGYYFHLDLLKCNLEGSFTLKTASSMDGYVWDYSVYSEAEPPTSEPPTSETTTSQTEITETGNID